MRLFVLTHPDFVGDNNQLRGIAKACTGFTTTTELHEQQITKEDLSLPNTTVLTAGDHGILVAEQIRKEYPQVRVIWSGHLFFDIFATLNASYWPHFIALPKSVITETVWSLCPAQCRIIPTDGVAHNVNDYTVVRALDDFPQETLPPSTISSCVGIVLAGDAPRPDKTILYFSEDDACEQANKIVAYINSYFADDAKHVAIMVTNGPRTGKHDAQTGVLRTPDPHRIACIDPTSQAFLAVLKAHFPNQLFFYDFQFGQPSAYLPMMARTARAERALWFVPAESSSMVTESSYLSTKGIPAIVYTPQSANEMHLALVEESRRSGIVSLLENPPDLPYREQPKIQLASVQIASELSLLRPSAALAYTLLGRTASSVNKSETAMQKELIAQRGFK